MTSEYNGVRRKHGNTPGHNQRLPNTKSGPKDLEKSTTTTAAVVERITILPRDIPRRPPPPRGQEKDNDVKSVSHKDIGAKRKRRKPRSKTVSKKIRRAIVLDVIAAVEARKMSSGPSTSVPAVLEEGVPASTEDTKNLGKAWSKTDLSKLALLVEDPAYLQTSIPDHSCNGTDLDWECIARHFGRFSKGGTAVKLQYYSVLRLMKVGYWGGMSCFCSV